MLAREQMYLLNIPMRLGSTMIITILIDLAYALGIAISPMPIVTVILILIGENGRRNALAFLIGWIIGLSILAVVFSYLAANGLSQLDSMSIIARPIVQILLGIGIAYFAYRQWDKPLVIPTDETPPKWLVLMDEWTTKSSDVFTPARALLLGIVMSALSLKNIALMFGIVLVISQTAADQITAFVLFAIFVLVGSLAVSLPVSYALYKGDSAPQALQQWKEWVIRNRSRAFAPLLFLVGAVLVLNGVIAFIEKTQAG